MKNIVIKIRIRSFVFITSIISGLMWGIIYLSLAVLHDMPKMFNNEFIFLIANIFDVNVNSIFQGFIFAIIDGLLIGAIGGGILLVLKRKFID